MTARVVPSRDPDATAMRRLVGLVRWFSGLEFPANRRQGLDRAVDSAIVRHGLGGVAELVALLADPARRPDLEEFTASLTIGETHFFRNAPQLEAIRTRVLPELVARRSRERRLRIWSAGCSTGEEPYSLAMVVDTLLPRRDGWDVLILATDINRGALERARRGAYGEWSFRQVPQGVKGRYFARRGREYHIAPEIRDMVTFAYLNLVGDGYPSPVSNTQAMDLILCRNVLIYFAEDTANAVVTRLDQALAPGGWLVAGHAESPMPVFRERFTPRDFPSAVIYQKRTPRAAPIVTMAPSSPAKPIPTVVVASPPSAADSLPADAEVARALARWGSGDAEGALRVLQDLADRDPADVRPLQAAAKVLASVLRLETAEHTARLALERDPLAPSLHYLHGLILQELGRDGDAVEALRRCVCLDPAFVLGHVALASLMAAGGHRDRADRALATAIDLVRERPPDEPIEGGDGVTYGRLLELAEAHRQLITPGAS